MSVPPCARIASPRLPSAGFGGFVPASPLTLFMRWYDRHLQRRALAELDERLLRDIGLTPDDVAAELRKPFWR